MPIDIKSLSARELGSLITTAKKRQALLSKRAPVSQVRSKLTRLAKAEGYTIEELFGGASAPARPRKSAGGARKLGKVPPKYRNPDNPKETWTGRGKQPRWLAAHTGKGRDVSEFLIPGTATPTPKARPAGARKRVVKKAKK